MEDKRVSERKRLDLAIEDALDYANPEAKSLFAFIQRCLKQYNLATFYEASEILQEAYIRGIKAIQFGKDISSPFAWLRATAYNIVREHRREINRYDQFGAEQTQELNIDSPTEQVLYRELQSLMKEALKELDDQELKLINLRYIEDLSWFEVRKALEADGEGSVSEVVLRKRNSRILSKLRSKISFTREED